MSHLPPAGLHADWMNAVMHSPEPAHVLHRSIHITNSSLRTDRVQLLCRSSWPFLHSFLKVMTAGRASSLGVGGGKTCLVTTTKRQAQKSKALQTLCSSPFFQAWVKTNGPGYSNTAALWWLAAASLLAMLVVIQAYFATTMSFHTDLSIPRKTTCPL